MDVIARDEERRRATVGGRDRRILNDLRRDGSTLRAQVDQGGTGRAEWLAEQRVLPDVRRRSPPGRRTDPNRRGRRRVTEGGRIRRSAGVAVDRVNKHGSTAIVETHEFDIIGVQARTRPGWRHCNSPHRGLSPLAKAPASQRYCTCPRRRCFLANPAHRSRRAPGYGRGQPGRLLGLLRLVVLECDVGVGNGCLDGEQEIRSTGGVEIHEGTLADPVHVSAGSPERQQVAGVGSIVAGGGT